MLYAPYFPGINIQHKKNRRHRCGGDAERDPADGKESDQKDPANQTGRNTQWASDSSQHTSHYFSVDVAVDEHDLKLSWENARSIDK